MRFLPSRNGLQQEGEGCDGRLVQAFPSEACRLECCSMFSQCMFSLCRGSRHFLRTHELQVWPPSADELALLIRFFVQQLLKRGGTTPSSQNPRVTIASRRQAIWRRRRGEVIGDTVPSDAEATDSCRQVDTDCMLAATLTKQITPEKLVAAINLKTWSLQQPSELVQRHLEAITTALTRRTAQLQKTAFRKTSGESWRAKCRVFFGKLSLM